jgi:hypothetical protein
MPAKPKWRIGFVVLAFACIVPSLSGQMGEIRRYRGKQVTCVYSGLVGVAKSCGTEGYARVFTGIVRSAVKVGDTNKLLDLVPDEVFVGDSSEAIAITDQACLHGDIDAGDKWLFYLQRDPKNHTLVLSYASPSGPISEAEDDIATLRDLQRLKNIGVLIGNIEHLPDSEDSNPTPLANHRVVAKNVTNGTEYTASTNEMGHFKFNLPAGDYEVATAPEYDLQEVENLGFGMLSGSVPVEKNTCWEHNFCCRAHGYS